MGWKENLNGRPWEEQELAIVKEFWGMKTPTEIQFILNALGYTRSIKAIQRKAEVLRKTSKPKPVDVFQTLQNTLNESNELEFEIDTEEDDENSVNFFNQDSTFDIPTPYDDAWDKIRHLKYEYLEEYRHRLTGLMDPAKSTHKILCLSDFHIPFERDDLIYQIIEKHSDADDLVLNGDILDLHAISTWPKEKSVALRKEYEIALSYLKEFSRRFRRVFITRGNHEYRLNRYFHSNVSPSISFMVSKEILGRLARGERYDANGEPVGSYNFKNIFYFPGAEAWYLKIGKTIFNHPMSFSSVPGKTATNAQTYFMERDDVDCIVTAHTHQMANIPYRNKLCLEQGCLCAPLDYEKQGKLIYRAMVLGYAVVYQDLEGNCDFNKSRTYYLGTQYPVKRNEEEFFGRYIQTGED